MLAPYWRVWFLPSEPQQQPSCLVWSWSPHNLGEEDRQTWWCEKTHPCLSPEGRSCLINGTVIKSLETFNISFYILYLKGLFESQVQPFNSDSLRMNFSFSSCITRFFTCSHSHLPSFLVHASLFNSKAGKMLFKHIFWVRLVCFH